jgi:N-acyl amino acid synthase of PEP-CTERM/exosortase system
MSAPFPAVRHPAPRAHAGSQVAPSHRGGERLKDLYDSYFEIVLAETEEQRASAFRLRYEVYCVEHPYEDPAQNPNGMETDPYDPGSLHALLLHRPSRNLVGTVRLILPKSGGKSVHMPIRHVCDHELVAHDNDTLPRANTAEISRFAVSKSFRRRANEETSVGSFTTVSDPRRQIPNTSLGLMQAIVAMAAKADVSHLCAVMEPTLLRMLRRLGIHFIPIGPQVDYHGRRQPCYSDLDVLLTRIWIERPEVWELITQDGYLWPLNTDLLPSLRAGAEAL